MLFRSTAMVVNADNKVEVRTLKAERTVGDRWLVTEGLQAGDRVITEGLQFVQPGASVDPYPAGNVKATTQSSDSSANAANQAQ